MHAKLTIIDSKSVGELKYTFDQKCKYSELSVQYYSLLDLFLWISGVLNYIFVSGLNGLASLPFHPQ